MPEVTVNGTTLHYEEAGAGAPMLLVHGGLGTAMLHWWRDIPFYAERFRVIAPDMRGYGRSSPPREFPPDFYERDAADMAALLCETVAHPAHVIGWSDGAVVALVLTVTHPTLVRTLTVVAGEARLTEAERELWPALIDTSTWPESAVRRFVEAQGPLNWPGILEKMLAGYNAVLDSRGGEIISGRIAEIRCPTLIVHGDADATVPVLHAHELHAAIPGAQLHIYPGAGHLPHREHEADVRACVLDFIAQHESDAARRTAT